MVRALVFLIIFSSSLLSQSNDPIQIFKIRLPEKRIEGLFTNTENTPIKTMYYFTLDGSIYIFKTNLNEEEFHNKLIREQEDFPYQKASYLMERGSEKVIITIPMKTDTSYLLGKYRPGTFFLVHSDTIIQTDNWNVGSFIIAKTEMEKEEHKHQMQIFEGSVFSKNCNQNFFWGGNIETIKLNLKDTADYRKKKATIATVPIGNIESIVGNRFKYYTEKYYTYFNNDSQVVSNPLIGNCSEAFIKIDTIKQFTANLHHYERFGVKNYLIKSNDKTQWIVKLGCEVIITTLKSKKVEYLMELESKEVFKKLKNITPISIISLNKSCGKQ
jgi:hypothetical protein